jgi:hypothetical protein
MEIKFLGLGKNYFDQMIKRDTEHKILLDKALAWFIVEKIQQPRSMQPHGCGGPEYLGRIP